MWQSLPLLTGVHASMHSRKGCFNTAEGWTIDASADLSSELGRRCDLQDAPRNVPISWDMHAWLVPGLVRRPRQRSRQALVTLTVMLRTGVGDAS